MIGGAVMGSSHFVLGTWVIISLEVEMSCNFLTFGADLTSFHLSPFGVLCSNFALLSVSLRSVSELSWSMPSCWTWWGEGKEKSFMRGQCLFYFMGSKPLGCWVLVHQTYSANEYFLFILTYVEFRWTCKKLGLLIFDYITLCIDNI